MGASWNRRQSTTGQSRAAGQDARGQALGFALIALILLHERPNAILEGRNQPNGQSTLSRQHELHATADEDEAFMLGGKQHQFAKAADVFGLRHQLILEPLAEHLVEPGDGALVDKLQSHARQVFLLGKVVEQLAIHDFPATFCRDGGRDAGGVGAGFSGNGDVRVD